MSATKSFDEYLIDHFETNWDTDVIVRPEMFKQEIGNIKKYPCLLFIVNLNTPTTPADLSLSFYEMDLPFHIIAFTGNDQDRINVKDQIFKLIKSMEITGVNAGYCIVNSYTDLPNQKSGHETLYICNRKTYELFI